MKLYEIPNESRIKAETYEGKKKLGDFIIYHHPDGMYSYCTVEGKPDKVCHLSISQEVKQFKNYYKLAKSKND